MSGLCVDSEFFTLTQSYFPWLQLSFKKNRSQTSFSLLRGKALFIDHIHAGSTAARELYVWLLIGHTFCWAPSHTSGLCWMNSQKPLPSHLQWDSPRHSLTPDLIPLLHCITIGSNGAPLSAGQGIERYRLHLPEWRWKLSKVPGQHNDVY